MGYRPTHGGYIPVTSTPDGSQVGNHAESELTDPGQRAGGGSNSVSTHDTVQSLIHTEFPNAESITIVGAVYNRRAGDSRVMESQAIELYNAGYDVEIIALTADLDPPEGVGLRSFKIGQDRNLGRIIRLLFPLSPLFLLALWWLRGRDVVLAHRYPSNAVGSAATRLFGTGYVYWSHASADAWNLFEGVERIWVRTIQRLETRWFLNPVDCVAAVSEPSARYIEHYVDGPVATVPNHTVPNRFGDLVATDRVAREYGLNLDAIMVLFVGRLTTKKNIVRLVELFDEVRDSGEAVQLVVVGTASRSDYREQLADIAGKGIVFTGAVADSELGRLYDLADVFATCSLEEGWGLPITEADSFDTIIVGFDNHPAAVQAERSFTVPKEDYGAFAGALREAIDTARASTKEPTGCESEGDASHGEGSPDSATPRTVREPDDW